MESIQKTIYQNDGNAIYRIDKIADQEDTSEELLDHIVLEELVDGLEETEQKIIRLRYYENKTQTEIAKEIGISQVQVSRLEKKILKKMRQAYQQ